MLRSGCEIGNEGICTGNYRDPDKQQVGGGLVLQVEISIKFEWKTEYTVPSLICQLWSRQKNIFQSEKNVKSSQAERAKKNFWGNKKNRNSVLVKIYGVSAVSKNASTTHFICIFQPLYLF